MTDRKRLPLLVERSVHEAAMARQEAVFAFEQKVLSEGKTSCRKGCHDCCYHPVTLSVLEGISLYQWLDSNRLWTKQLRGKFLEAMKATWGLAPEVWMLSVIPCPLLKDGQCSAYEARPSMCRTSVSKGDPYECHPHRVAFATGLVSKRDVNEAVAKEETRILRKHRLEALRYPLAAAVLLGERMVEKRLELIDSLVATLQVVQEVA